MGKKILKYLSLILCFTLLFSLTACVVDDGDNNEPPHEHNFVEGICECGEEDPNYEPPHEHNFVEGECACGEEDPNYEPPHEHNFVEGICECGEKDPNYHSGELPWI